MQPTGICGGEIARDNKVGRAAYPGRLIVVVERNRLRGGCGTGREGSFLFAHDIHLL
jgi:hypothetical protein